MDAIRKSPTYAEGQIRVLLSDLKSTNHTVRTKAVKRFQDYISSYRPQIYDDDVDYLFCGAVTEEADGVPMGLLYYSGLASGSFFIFLYFRMSLFSYFFLFILFIQSHQY